MLHESSGSDPEPTLDANGAAAMTRLFISHSSKDDAFVRGLQQALADLGHDGWIDSRELRGGDPLWLEIRTAIDEASAYAVVVSTDALASRNGSARNCAMPSWCANSAAKTSTQSSRSR